jgi:ubiquinone/menaquinone biosynthesis C-methylase UbiE
VFDRRLNNHAKPMKNNHREIKISGGDTGSAINLRKRIALLSRYVNLKDKYVLDCGCGAGDYLLEFLKYTSNAYGIEHNQDKVTAFRAKGILTDKVSQGDIQKMDFEDAFFDCVFMNEVLEHVPNESSALREIRRVLKKDGIFALFAPNRLYPFETHAISIKRFNISLPIWAPFVPYLPLVFSTRILSHSARNYFPAELRKIVENAGFKILDQQFLQQTFENISKEMPNWFSLLAPYLRHASNIFETLPMLRTFGVSQVVIAQKTKV